MEATSLRSESYIKRLFRVFDYNGIRIAPPRYLFRMATAPFRQPPSFLIIGAAKAGTTSLLSYLAQHPDVVEPMRKEVHFFDMHYSVGPAFYLSNFPIHEEGKITGEATPDYLCHPHCPERVREVVGDAKLITILRNPIDRAYSHYQMMVRGGHENGSFERALELEGKRARVHIERQKEDPDYWHPGMFAYAYTYRGHYIDHIENWLERFDREDILILTYRGLAQDPERVYGRMLDHLDLEWPEEVDIDFSPRNPGGGYPKMSDETRRRLAREFEESNERLYKFLGRVLEWE